MRRLGGALVVWVLGGCGSFGTAESRPDAGPSTDTRPGGGAGVVFDSASSGVAENAASVTFSHTVGPGANRLLVVASHSASSTYETARVTYGDRELARLGPPVEVATDEEDCTSTLFYLVDPPEGTAAVVAYLEDSKRPMVAFAMSFHGVDPRSPFGKSDHARAETETGTTATVAVESAPSELIVDSLCLPRTNVGTVAAGPEQTVRVQAELPSKTFFVFGSTAPGGPGRSVTWSFGAAPFSLQAVAIRAAAR